METHKLLERIAWAIADLWWSSEADYPWQVVCLPENIDNWDSHQLLQHYQYPLDSPVATTTLDSFLAIATAEHEWHSAAEKTEVQRYRELSQLLEANLENVRVYLVGEVEIDVYVLGYTCDRQIIGISTKTVET